MSKDIVHDVANAVDHNRYTVIALALVVAVAVWVGGCTSKTLSVLPDKAVKGIKVTRDELRAETVAVQANFEAQVKTFEARVEAAAADLDKQDAFKAAVVAAVPDLASMVGVPPGVTDMVSGVLGLGGLGTALGLFLDNRRKDKKIKTGKETETNEAVAS